MQAPRQQGYEHGRLFYLAHGRIATKVEVLEAFVEPDSQHEFVRERCKNEFWLGWRKAEEHGRARDRLTKELKRQRGERIARRIVEGITGFWRGAARGGG